MEETNRKILIVSDDLQTTLLKFPRRGDRKFVKISTKNYESLVCFTPIILVSKIKFTFTSFA